jgi:hypothetical protein
MTNLFKVKYESLNKSFEKFKDKRNRILLVIDIGKILSTLYSIINKKELIVTNKTKIQLICSIFSIIAHYRHYYYNNLHSSNSILLYCGTPDNYKIYEDILNDIKEICNYLPSIIYIPKIDGLNNRYLYLHLACYIIEHTKKSSEAMNKKLIVNVLGNNIAEYQFLSIIDRVYYITLNQSEDKKIMEINHIWENLYGKDERFCDPTYRYELKILLLPQLIIYKKYNNLEEKDKIKGPININSRNENKINKLFEFINKKYNDILWCKYGEELLVKEDLDKYNEIMKKVLYTGNNSKIKPYINNFIKNWNKKLKDKKIDSINDYLNILEGNNIDIAWLNEDKMNI